MANSKFDDKLNRMTYLMEFKSPSTNRFEKPSSVEYHTVGADGKVYGILREGTKYYIKTTEQGKETLAESYEYIGGFNNRKNNEFSSYDNATKHLEINMINLNESYGKHEDVSVANLNRTHQAFAMLTEEARKELNRMNQIFENSGTIGKGIGNHGDLGNDTGHENPSNTKDLNKPFSQSVGEPGKGSVDSGAKSKAVKTPKMDDDSMRKGGEGDPNTDVTGKIKGGMGDTPATDHPKGAKAVKALNEAMNYFDDELGINLDANRQDGAEDFATEPEMGPEDENDWMELYGDENSEDAMNYADGGNPDNFSDEDLADDYNDEDLAGLDSDFNDYDEDESDDYDEDDDYEDVDYDGLIAEGEMGVNDRPLGPDEDVMKNYKSKYLNGKHISWNKVDGNDSLEPLSEGEMGVNDRPLGPDEDVMKNYKSKYRNGKHISWNKVDGKDSLEPLKESINRITRDVVRNLMGKRPMKESVAQTIDRLVKEEINRLNVWGKHPRYGQQPMTLPDNNEVLAGTARGDWNDDSTKGSERYGKRIGSSKPFDQVVNDVADNALAALKESLGLKKK